ncbi:MAG TPA: hypothetical protein VG870_05755 [Chitinophagaceae bacterium]|nr:hypothetical protein [Chitinophagaceae bacterium]
MTGTQKLISLLTALLLSVVSFAQDSSGKEVEMADQMRSNGRIYVVIAVMLTILAGLILYVVRLDKKIAKWEKQEGKS